MFLDYLILLLLLRLRDRLPKAANDDEDKGLKPYAGLESEESQYIRRVK